jgi:hypothetical protein
MRVSLKDRVAMDSENWVFVGTIGVLNADLVGGLEHEWVIFPFSWECHNPN